MAKIHLNKLGLAIALGLSSSLVGVRAQALPGQSTEVVTAWIQGHPTLRPGAGEKLLVRKYDTAAQRFIFQASVLSPGKVTPPRNSGVIRSEKISLFDMVNGVTRDRLEESLRVIYGTDLFQDYQQAQTVYSYPNANTIRDSRIQATPLKAALQGELRLGDRYAYWLEIAQNPVGQTYTGQIVVLLKSDLDQLNSELRLRR